MLINKFKDKLKETKGADETIEGGVILIIFILVLTTLIGFSHLIYKNYKVVDYRYKDGKRCKIKVLL